MNVNELIGRLLDEAEAGYGEVAVSVMDDQGCTFPLRDMSVSFNEVILVGQGDVNEDINI